jgi:hypothetical protein
LLAVSSVASTSPLPVVVVGGTSAFPLIVARKSIVAAEAADRQPMVKAATRSEVRNMHPPFVAVDHPNPVRDGQLGERRAESHGITLLALEKAPLSLAALRSSAGA